MRKPVKIKGVRTTDPRKHYMKIYCYIYALLPRMLNNDDIYSFYNDEYYFIANVFGTSRNYN